jgi:hypothetical protein
MRDFNSVSDAVAYSPTLASPDVTPDSPKVTVLKPDLNTGAVCRPTEILVEWNATNAEIDLKTFEVKASIGFFSKDLTDSVLKTIAAQEGARLDTKGLKFTATSESVPNSITAAKISLRIADTMKRKTQKDFVVAFKSC